MRFRNEYKYRIDLKQKSILEIRTAGILVPDSHSTDSGMYTVRSVYFDNLEDTFLFQNLSGTDPSTKYRIRYYNRDTSWIVLEKKSKVRGLCLKESCVISKNECMQLISGDVPQIDENWEPLKKRLISEMYIKGLKPKVIVTYDRNPYLYTAGNVRVTFDSNISSSNEVNLFLEGTYASRPVMPLGESLMEIKWDEVLPKHIKETLLLENLIWTSFSKYYMCRMHHL